MEQNIPHQEPVQRPFVGSVEEREDEIDLLEIFFTLLDHIWVIAIVTILGGLLTLFYAMNFTNPKYEATSKLYAVSVTEDKILQMVDLQMGTNLKADYQELMKSRPLLETVRDNLKLNMGTDSLAKMISITNPTDTRVLIIQVRSESPQQAMDVANELAIQSISYLPAIMECEPPNLVESAIFPTTAVSGSYTMWTAIGLAAGFVLACGFYVVQFLLNDTFRSPDDFQKYLNLPALAVIPEEDMGDFNGSEAAKKKAKKKQAKAAAKEKAKGGL